MLFLTLIHCLIILNSVESLIAKNIPSRHIIAIESRISRCQYLLLSRKKCQQQDEKEGNTKYDGISDNHENSHDTIRVRIWKALCSSNGKEFSLRQLGAIVNEQRIGDLKSHIVHVEKQAKTVGNKSVQWKQRRGIPEETRKVKIVKRKANGNIFIKLVS